MREGSAEDDEGAIQAQMEQWFAATAERDIDAVMEGIASDVVSYGAHTQGWPEALYKLARLLDAHDPSDTSSKENAPWP